MPDNSSFINRNNADGIAPPAEQFYETGLTLAESAPMDFSDRAPILRQLRASFDVLFHKISRVHRS
jgi:hypothetical protein